jgi:hypothetical protein
MTNETDNFCRKYDAYVQPSSRMHRRQTRFTNWQDYADVDVFKSLPVETIKCVEVHMPEDRFRALLEIDHWVNDVIDRGYRDPNKDFAKHLVNEHQQELVLREQYPALRIAWEKYQTVLRMCR